MLTGKDYCDYDTCVALKELGYVGTGEECSYFGAYFNNGEDIFSDDLNNNEIGINEYLRVPLFLAQKWLREERNILVIVDRDSASWYYGLYGLKNNAYEVSYTGNEFDSYEEALSEGIKEAVKILNEEEL